jgi:hypothetical protein
MTEFDSQKVAVLGSEVIRARRRCVEATTALRIAVHTAASVARNADKGPAHGALELEPTEAELREARETLRKARRLAQTARARLARAERAHHEALLGGMANLRTATLN